MALIVQDDAGAVSGANAYISLVAFKAYHNARGNNYLAYTDTEIENAIIRSTDYVDIRFNFIGSKLNARDQLTQWPRSSALDRDGWYVTGIPLEIKDAIAEYAFRALSSLLIPDPVTDKTGREVESTEIKAGPITKKVSYIGRGQNTFKPFPKADRILANLLEPVGMIARG